MIEPLVRTARPDDAVELTALEDEARTAVADQRGGERWLAEHRRRGPAWAPLSDDASNETVLVAELDAVPVGYLVLARGGDIACVADVWVTPDARELGFGDELLATAVAQARAGGATWLEGEALPGDRNTKNLYERAGITARLITVSTRL